MLESLGPCKQEHELQLRFDPVTSDYSLSFPSSRHTTFLFYASGIKSQSLFFILKIKAQSSTADLMPPKGAALFPPTAANHALQAQPLQSLFVQVGRVHLA